MIHFIKKQTIQNCIVVFCITILPTISVDIDINIYQILGLNCGEIWPQSPKFNVWSIEKFHPIYQIWCLSDEEIWPKLGNFGVSNMENFTVFTKFGVWKNKEIWPQLLSHCGVETIEKMFTLL